MFQELDTPPSRRGWRCGLPLSCVSLITADTDHAFEACSSSAVLPAWKVISQADESSFSSNSFLVRRGRRELWTLVRSQSFGRGWLSSTALVLAWALFSFTSVSLVTLGSMVWQIQGMQWLSFWARQNFAVWDSNMSISGWVYIFLGAPSPQLSFVEEIRGLMCLWVAAYFVVAAPLFLCALAIQSHSRWSLEQERVSIHR